jgi:hypothetical protein
MAAAALTLPVGNGNSEIKGKWNKQCVDGI